MKIYKETNVKNPLYITILDSGVTLHVFDGYAEGSDGNTYRCVLKKNNDEEYELVGWIMAD